MACGLKNVSGDLRPLCSGSTAVDQRLCAEEDRPPALSLAPASSPIASILTTRRKYGGGKSRDLRSYIAVVPPKLPPWAVVSITMEEEQAGGDLVSL
uniref:Uncharacterized protein n=1 Tax=Oryza sativa subsp. japonica TaxID=39947 RepID=Q6H542_ORYSJ|nr:hypothetical protein [Oryza sativa Japonica Group]BAD26157.1 hypothetical protein [Oryza sativa Japonica Group]